MTERHPAVRDGLPRFARRSHIRQDLLVGEVYRQAHLRRMPAPLAKLSIQSLFKRADPPWIGPALLLVREGLLVSLVLGR